MLKLMLKLETPGGHILLQGLPGVGKMSLARLAAHHTHARLLTCFFPPTKMPDVIEEQLKNLKQLFRAYREAIKKTGNPQPRSWFIVSDVCLYRHAQRPQPYRERVLHRTREDRRSKLCNVLFSLELARRLEGSGVTVNSLHPGHVKTDILIPCHTIYGRIMKIAFFLWAKDSELGAQTNIYLAVSEEVEGVSGRYFTDCKEVKTSKLARDKDLAKRLWEVSEKAVKLRPEEKFC
ncbi:hypothetical protein Pcinc_000034 [Petrolisthes cinctipes]|uniref:Uncharacterized protein n=1 Tax=Petrolisthes cinctipes TaxID=88211 RepID=A0AAE1L6P4_PETCI|nr:hypothetical protein Pcinc_000034 [Petrolisthes cinctipes]